MAINVTLIQVIYFYPGPDVNANEDSASICARCYSVSGRRYMINVGAPLCTLNKTCIGCQAISLDVISGVTIIEYAREHEPYETITEESYQIPILSNKLVPWRPLNKNKGLERGGTIYSCLCCLLLCVQFDFAFVPPRFSHNKTFAGMSI